VTKKVGGVTTVFHYDLDGKVIAESLADGTITAEYLYMGKIRIAKFEVDRGKMHYYLNDRLGTPQIMTDDNGNVVWEASYKPFGQARVNPKSTVENNFRFPGQYHDQETGFHYNYHRYYDPGTGRYLTPDPIGLVGGINLFAYIENNPINFIDPSGLSGEDLEQTLISLGRVCFPLPSKRGDWNIAWKGPISGHVDVIFADLFGAVGAAHWMKLREIREERSLIRRWYCCECEECGCECDITYDPPEIESRYRTDVLQHFHGRAYRISQGFDPQVGDFWWSVNPWTGQTVKGWMPPGP
jgi:RHS repeat-associated protein